MQTEAMKQPLLTIRPATSADKAPVLAFCATTWDHGDYIDQVWDDWLAAPDSTLLVGTLNERPVALAHVSVQQGEGWCEGVRVDPAERGRGLGVAIMRACVDEARRRQAQVLRLLTSRANQAMQTILPRLGFAHCFDVSWLSAPALGPDALPGPLEVLPPARLPELLRDLADAALLRATDGLYADGWSFATPTPTRLAAYLERGQVVAVPGCEGWAIVSDDGESDDTMIRLAVGDLPTLLRALRAHPLAVQNGEQRLFVPAGSPGAELALAAGYTADERAFGVYALAL